MNASAPQFSELEFHFIRLSLADFIVAALIPYRDNNKLGNNSLTNKRFEVNMF